MYIRPTVQSASHVPRDPRCLGFAHQRGGLDALLRGPLSIAGDHHVAEPHPAAARASACNSVASSSDPTTASTPYAATASAFALLRTRPRTIWPSAIRADATAPPIKPFAPVMKICILPLPRFGRDESVAANSRSLGKT